jgi:hypothetical protein
MLGENIKEYVGSTAASRLDLATPTLAHFFWTVRKKKNDF